MTPSPHRWRDGGEGAGRGRNILHDKRSRRLDLPAKCPFFMAVWRAGLAEVGNPSAWFGVIESGHARLNSKNQIPRTRFQAAVCLFGIWFLEFEDYGPRTTHTVA
jgi:hypothetical protein